MTNSFHSLQPYNTLTKAIAYKWLQYWCRFISFLAYTFRLWTCTLYLCLRERCIPVPICFFLLSYISISGYTMIYVTHRHMVMTSPKALLTIHVTKCCVLYVSVHLWQCFFGFPLGYYGRKAGGKPNSYMMTAWYRSLFPHYWPFPVEFAEHHGFLSHSTLSTEVWVFSLVVCLNYL